MAKIRAAAIVGCTGSGKSELAMELARRLSGEIVCMDSMQIYRRMDIGTAKPSPADQAKIPHHMLDIVEPDESFTVADYGERVIPLLREIEKRGHIPLLAGGTGLYLKTLMDGMSLGGIPENPALREELFRLSERENGRLLLHERLKKADPASAERLHPNDLRRVIRAIEISETTGRPASETRGQNGLGEADILPLAIRVDRSVLYPLLDRRVDRMLEAGLLKEVEGLIQSGIRPEAQSMQGIGYKELYPVAEGKAALADARRQILLATRHYAKRQETWFRHEERVRWLEKDAALAGNAERLVKDWFEGKETG